MKYTVTYINGGAVNCPFVFETEEILPSIYVS